MSTEQPITNPELEQWLAGRQRELRIVRTTVTPSGSVLDWVPIESQTEDGHIATPPPAPRAQRSSLRKVQPVRFELDDPSVERGPEGTVPIARPELSKLNRQIALKDYLAKRGVPHLGRRQRGERPIDPDPAGFFHNTLSQTGSFFGCEATFSVWAPVIDLPSGGKNDDHSILQVWLYNSATGTLQTLEGGWTVDRGLNGDFQPHLFTYYTTNGYTKDGNNKGGYNRVHKGWVQVSKTIFPGIIAQPVSTFAETNFEFAMKFQLFQEPGSTVLNWWVQVGGEWIGFYPASLYGKGLGENVDTSIVGGEVASGLKDPDSTLDQMGSGAQASAGFGKAAYIRGLRNQIDMDGTMADNTGVLESDVAGPLQGADPYTITVATEDDALGTHVFVGGPTDTDEPLATWLTNEGPLPKGIWDGTNWPEAQKSRASNNRLVIPPGGANSTLQFAISGTRDNPEQITFNLSVDRAGSDPTCWAGLKNNSIVAVGPMLQQLKLTLRDVNARGLYIREVKGATQPFQVSVTVA
jgi:hypothetical protein